MNYNRAILFLLLSILSFGCESKAEKYRRESKEIEISKKNEFENYVSNNHYSNERKTIKNDLDKDNLKGFVKKITEESYLFDKKFDEYFPKEEYVYSQTTFYNMNGMVDKIIYHPGGDNSIYYIHKFIYNNKNDLTTKYLYHSNTEYLYSNNEPENKYTFIYEDNINTIKMYEYHKFFNEIKIYTRTYDNKGYLLKEVQSSKKNENGQIDYLNTIYYTYDQNGNNDGVHHFSDYGVREEYHFEYDNNNFIKNLKRFWINSLDYKLRFKYELKNNNWIKKVVYESSGIPESVRYRTIEYY